MTTIHKIGITVGEFIGTVAGEPFKYVGEQINNKYVLEIGESIKASSSYTGDTVGQFVNGIVSTTTGIVKNDEILKVEGLNDIGTSITNISRGVYKGLVQNGENIKDVIQGTVDGNKEQLVKGTKGIGKVTAISTLTFGVFDLLVGVHVEEANAAILGVDNDKNPINYTENTFTTEPHDTNSVQTITNKDDVYYLNTRNEGLAGLEHPETQVPFVEKNLIDTQNYVGVFPDFQEVYGVQIPNYMYVDSDDLHFSYANHQLAFEIANNPGFASLFSSTQIDQMQQGETPDGYVWHHSEDVGRLELVDSYLHEQTGHTGGRELWGGESNYR